MSETEKHLEKAQKLLQKGRSDAALREYLEVLQQHPTHEIAAQAASELYQALGRKDAAAALLLGVFDRQTSMGNEAAAIATYRKLSRLTALTPERTLNAARFLEKINRREALDAYHAAFRSFMAAGRKAEALATQEAIAAADPSVPELCQLGELAAEMGDRGKAGNAFLLAGDFEAPGEDKPLRTLQLYSSAYAVNPGNLRIALVYAHALLKAASPESASKAVAVLQPLACSPEAALETKASYGRALLAADRLREAEPFLWPLIEQDPSHVQYVLRLIGEELDAGEEMQALALARRLEHQQRTAGRLRDHARAMAVLAEGHASCIGFLEYLAELFNAANREADYCRTLLQLFELHYAAGNFLRAADCLDHAAEVDPYEPGYQHRLNLLQGKVASNRLRLTVDRLKGAVKSEPENAPARGEPVSSEPTVLEDLLLQAEVFLRYSLRPRAIERLDRVRKLFPDEVLKNQQLRELCARAGVPLPVPRGVARPPRSANAAEVDNIARVTEITRNIHRQSTPKSVFFTAVNETGHHWSVSRCIAVLSTPGKPPALALEYCAPGIEAFDVHRIVKLIGLLQPLIIAQGPLVLSNALGPSSLASLKPFSDMGINSLLVSPLMEGSEHIGLLLLAECGASRNWSPSDNLVLKTIADEIVLALANARLRRLVKNLAITEEKSGLLKRASYLDVLLSEVNRSTRQKSTVSLILLSFAQQCEPGHSATESVLEQIGQLVCAHVRQNDIAVRYDPATVALILPDTDQKGAVFTIDRLRPLLNDLRLAHGGKIPTLTAGVAEAVCRGGFDPEDIVTELINRVEAALQVAVTKGGQCVLQA